MKNKVHYDTKGHSMKAESNANVRAAVHNGDDELTLDAALPGEPGLSHDSHEPYVRGHHGEWMCEDDNEAHQYFLALETERTLSDQLVHTAQWMMAVSGTTEFEERQKSYYPLLEQWRNANVRLRELQSHVAIYRPALPMLETAMKLEEKRAIKEANVSSGTYERAQRRLFKEVDGFLCGK